jgi:hypothetical protein
MMPCMRRRRGRRRPRPPSTNRRSTSSLRTRQLRRHGQLIAAITLALTQRTPDSGADEHQRRCPSQGHGGQRGSTRSPDESRLVIAVTRIASHLGLTRERSPSSRPSARGGPRRERCGSPPVVAFKPRLLRTSALLAQQSGIGPAADRSRPRRSQHPDIPTRASGIAALGVGQGGMATATHERNSSRHWSTASGQASDSPCGQQLAKYP